MNILNKCCVLLIIIILLNLIYINKNTIESFNNFQKNNRYLTVDAFNEYKKSSNSYIENIDNRVMKIEEELNEEFVV